MDLDCDNMPPICRNISIKAKFKQGLLHLTSEIISILNGLELLDRKDQNTWKAESIVEYKET